MSNQEVWITLRIRSELDVEFDATQVAKCIARELYLYDGELSGGTRKFLRDAKTVEVVEVLEEAAINGLE